MQANDIVLGLIVFLSSVCLFNLGFLWGWYLKKPTMREAARMMAKRSWGKRG
jgi:hypothetical protein